MLISIGLYSSNISYISFLGVNFKSLTVEFHVLYILNMHIKFCSNWMLFTIRSINLFFIHNFRSQKLKILTFFDGIVIYLWFSWNFASMNDMIRTCNLIVRFLKFTINLKIYEKFDEFLFKLVWKETLFYIVLGKGARTSSKLLFKTHQNLRNMVLKASQKVYIGMRTSNMREMLRPLTLWVFFSCLTKDFSFPSIKDIEIQFLLIRFRICMVVNLTWSAIKEKSYAKCE